MIKIKEKEYTIKFIKDGGNRYESPLYHLVLKPYKHKGNILVVRNFAYYNQGYSQGTNPSGCQWFLQIIQYGCSGNGRGQNTPSTPYLSYDHIEFIEKVANGNYYTDFRFDFNEFEYGTTMKDIKSRMN